MRKASIVSTKRNSIKAIRYNGELKMKGELLPLPENIQQLLIEIEKVKAEKAVELAKLNKNRQEPITDAEYQFDCKCHFSKELRTRCLLFIGFLIFIIYLLLGNITGHHTENHWRANIYHRESSTNRNKTSFG